MILVTLKQTLYCTENMQKSFFATTDSASKTLDQTNMRFYTN